VSSPIAGEAGRPLALQACGRLCATFVQTSCQGDEDVSGRLTLVVLKVAFLMGVKAADTTSPEAVAGTVAASSYLRLEFAVPDAQLGTLGFLVSVVVRRHGSSTGWQG
jgi:hypothetical protein